ncbi:hypothetical protein A3K34_01320 [candidate division WWE3 bacterium RIFOXYC1_FULL_40_10]|uniref:Acyl carrier protein n=1 Tax=candidate division WWE3 bacterium RIFOXYA2_FULL_46_9 TaxID=1802636 RepID=A0A1F4W203_UNCKA|nr:MAG: hypothetical protein A3K58_01320 [candidate division WWE3 bacterium RIFOXYB1_FULL_40_22]OGC61510.1 MAG: hypothetical protein A3K37_01320 [candidate division WWE3 bacterium RIFOXYA1_FULL_40_11]OGC63442.1 MAG: hypothetical protein A2264_01800 [candidate division WWE3 bacterium RIFOXYA2_FULL_46_9]OGC64810.1 MAG: hypothetical protein A2326_02140 [candidate division WWE3 bacterium RIFOXYB2_FULL_41_6]OGC65893.1 MAG: hypothetical protein A3K34_01320 [candidate division WWE3 bacterium RIFOXYC1_
MSSGYLNKVRNIISSTSGLDKEEIHSESYFEDDLNIDEMELAEIIADLEEAYDIDIMDSKDEIETVQDLVDLLEEHLE